MPIQAVFAPRSAILFGTARPHYGTPHLHRLLALFAARRERRRLAEMPDHLLRDIGLTREQANAEAGRPVWDVPRIWRMPGQ
jgi:uncharacterized protein YjiS (DUF1127 family)